MQETLTAENKCPRCGKVNDRLSDLLGDAIPKPGDISICIQCGHVSIFTEGLQLREPNSLESVDILADQRIRVHQQAIWRRDQ